MRSGGVLQLRRCMFCARSRPEDNFKHCFRNQNENFKTCVENSRNRRPFINVRVKISKIRFPKFSKMLTEIFKTVFGHATNTVSKRPPPWLVNISEWRGVFGPYGAPPVSSAIQAEIRRFFSKQGFGSLHNCSLLGPCSWGPEGSVDSVHGGQNASWTLLGVQRVCWTFCPGTRMVWWTLLMGPRRLVGPCSGVQRACQTMPRGPEGLLDPCSGL